MFTRGDQRRGKHTNGRIKQLCETLPDGNDLSLNLEIEGVNQFIEHVGLESETAKQMQVYLSEETSEERQSGIAEVEEELIEATNSVTRPRPRPSASSSPGLSSTVRIVNEIPEDKDEPRIIQVEDIATDNQQNEENIQYEIATSEDSQKESQALGILFADHITFCLLITFSLLRFSLPLFFVFPKGP